MDSNRWIFALAILLVASLACRGGVGATATASPAVAMHSPTALPIEIKTEFPPARKR
jgi:hypothetical protein